MYVTSAARLRFDISYYINKLRIVQNKRLHNNSWSMTLPLWCELDSWHVPHLQTQSKPSNEGLIFMMITSFSTSAYAIHTNAFKTSIYCQQILKISLILPSLDFTEILPLCTATISSMDTADHWPMAREYSIWNATIASLQFWTEDLNPVTLSRATEHVNTKIFLFTYESHTTPAIWQNTVWMFCHSTKCSFWSAIITSWWRLQECFRYH